MSETIMSEITIAPNKNEGENNTTKINLCEILKGHEGETFYNSIVGDTILEKICINQAGDYCIVTNYMTLSEEGKLCDKGEMVIFPSKDQRDWNKWIAEQSPRVPKTWSDLVKANKVSSTTVQTSCDEKGDCSDTLSDSPIEKSALALLKIHQLIKVGYGGNVTTEDWKNDEWKYCIVYYVKESKFIVEKCYNNKQIIVFHTKEQSEEFLNYPENVQLLKDYFMV